MGTIEVTITITPRGALEDARTVLQGFGAVLRGPGPIDPDEIMRTLNTLYGRSLKAIAAVDAVLAAEESVTPALKACAHILERIEQDPDTRYLLGPATTSFELLVAAQADHEGRPVEEVQAERIAAFVPGKRRFK